MGDTQCPSALEAAEKWSGIQAPFWPDVISDPCFSARHDTGLSEDGGFWFCSRVFRRGSHRAMRDDGDPADLTPEDTRCPSVPRPGVRAFLKVWEKINRLCSGIDAGLNIKNVI